MTAMAKVQQVYDTITVMKEYNFHKPINITVVIEDNEKESNQSKVADNEENLMSTSLQNYNEHLNYAIHQQHTNMRNGPKNRFEISPSHRFNDNGSKANLEGFQNIYVSGNNVINTNPNTNNSYLYKELVNENNPPKSKSADLYNPHKSELLLIIGVADKLAFILEAYVKFCTLISKSKDQQYISFFKAECLRVKLNMFHKCWAITKNFLLQREKDQKFINKVLYKTKQISKVTLPNKHFEHLYGELLQWIKLKKSGYIKNNYQTARRNENLATHMHQASNVVSKPIPKNRPATNIFSSGPIGNQVTISVDPMILEKLTISQNIPNSTTTNLSYLQINNTDTHLPTFSNCSSICENNQQKKQSILPNAQLCSNSTYYNKAQLTIHAQNNCLNTRLTSINEVESQDTTRSSISRDSGTISPVTYVSPSESCINNVQPLAEYHKQRTLNFGTWNTNTFQPNFAIEGPSFWNNLSSERMDLEHMNYNFC